MRLPQNDWVRMENFMKMNDLGVSMDGGTPKSLSILQRIFLEINNPAIGVPLFQETRTVGNRP